MSRLQLTEQQWADLENQLQGAKDAGTFRRTLAVLAMAQGWTVIDVADLLRVSRVVVHRWIARYRQSGDAACLLDHRGGNNPSVWSDDLVAALHASLAHSPDYFGYQAVEWTVPLLQEHLAHWWGRRMDASTLRRELHRLEYVWKRPRYQYLPDPDRERKKAHTATTAAFAAPDGQAVRR